MLPAPDQEHVTTLSEAEEKKYTFRCKSKSYKSMIWCMYLSDTGKFISFKSETLYFIFSLLNIFIVLKPKINLEYSACSCV